MSRLHPDIAKAAREQDVDVVAITPRGAAFFRGPVSVEVALALLDRLPAGRPESPMWIEWYVVPEVYGV